MKYVWSVDQTKIAAEVTLLGRVTVWVNGTRVLRSYAFTFGRPGVAFQLPDGREVSLTRTRTLFVNGQVLKPLEPFVTRCDVCTTPMTANETLCEDCGHTQLSHRERRKHNFILGRPRRPLTLMSLLFAWFATNQFVQMRREDSAADAACIVAAAEGELVNADAQARADAHDSLASAHAYRVVYWTILATIMGLLSALARRIPFVALTLGLAVCACVTFIIVKAQGRPSFGVMAFTWAYLFMFARAFAEAHALRARAAP